MANLKRDLAEAHTRLENVVTFTRDEVAVSVGGPRGGRALTPPKQAMPGHPPGRCFKTACWCKA
ncbi:MAG TPA: hypothetical protein VEA38_22095 [Terriglobales bacterium]|nr:hypothetical protein [Terriglobales bacterium]